MERFRFRFDVKPRIIVSARVEAPLDEGKKLLREKGLEIPYAYQNAELKMQDGYDSDVASSGNWAREGILYDKK